MDQNEILVIRGDGIALMARELCVRAGLCGRIREVCRKQDPLIALKPNLLGPITASEGATTHPQIVEGVVGYLRENGFQNIIMMESSWVGDRTSDSLLVTGFDDLCEKMEIPFADLQEDASVCVDCAGMKLAVCRKALEADFLINLPVAKGHCQTGMTCALKNMKGCIPGSEKRRFHRLGLHAPIGHLSAGLRQGFVLADAICPDLTFEDGGNPVPLGRLVCAFDPVLLDAYVCRQMGLETEAVPYIRIAQECGAGNADLQHARITNLVRKPGDRDTVYVQVPDDPCSWRSESSSILKVRELVCEVDSCSACYGTLIPVLHELEQEEGWASFPHKLCIGQGWRHKTGKIGIGSCTSQFEHFLPGCPPDADHMKGFLQELMKGQP